jgi:hypothetical protein
MDFDKACNHSGPIGSEETRELVAYLSTVSRSIEGIPVIDSSATARFDVDDEVVFEYVYWPDIPTAAVETAKRLTQAIADSVGLARVQARLGVAAGVTVAIHHTRSTSKDEFRASAVYDVHEAGSMGTKHFDESGANVVIPGEEVDSADLGEPRAGASNR